MANKDKSHTHVSKQFLYQNDNSWYKPTTVTQTKQHDRNLHHTLPIITTYFYELVHLNQLKYWNMINMVSFELMPLRENGKEKKS